MLFKYRPKPILMGIDTETGEPVSLPPELLDTHIHAIGPPGSGKTRLLLWIYQQLIKRPDATVIVINPKGDFIRMARDAALNSGQGRRVILFDPADREHIIGYNPLRPNGLDVTTHAKAAREAIRSAWGQHSFDGTAQLARFLFLALSAARELEMTLVEAVQILRAGSAVREQVLARLQNAYVREALEYFDSLREARQEELAASTLARLEAFVMDETIRRIITQQTHNLDIGEVIEARQILLVNLEQFKPLRPDDVKLLGRLIVNDVVSHVFSRTGHRTPVFLLIDECHTFTTQDLCLVLDQGRELGLHCILAHQFPSQLLREDPSELLYGSVTECARTKIVFGGINVQNLELLAKELFLSEFNPLEVKDEIQTLELEPVETRKIVPTLGFGRGTTASQSRSKTRLEAFMSGKSDSEGTADAVGRSAAYGKGLAVHHGYGNIIEVTPDGDELRVGRRDVGGVTETESSVETASTQQTKSRSSSLQSARTDSWGDQEGTADAQASSWSLNLALTPFYKYLKRYRVSSRTFWTFEEFLIRCMQRLKGQPTAHFVLKTPGGRPIFVRAPEVGMPFIPQRLLNPVLARIQARPCYASPLQIEHEEAERRLALFGKPARAIEGRAHAAKAVRYKRNKGDSEA